MDKIASLAQQASSPSFRQHLVDLLVEICNRDTSIRADIAALREAELAVFDTLERELKACGFAGAKLERRPINPAISQHPFFSQLYYARGLSCEQTYAGRCNLLFCVDGAGEKKAGLDLAVNSHIDVIAPYFPPRVEGDTVFGRGACDDKGNVVAVLGALKLVGDYLQRNKIRLNKNFTGMFVIEEEMGGNGSLSLAIDRELKKRYDSLVVMEICESRLFPGNRGCVWYKVEGKVPGANLFECAAFIVEQLEHEGRSIKSESRHRLFPHRPVQTCHGILGDCGEHPSRINGQVSFDINFTSPTVPPAGVAQARQLLDDIIAFAVEEYTGRYGDKTKVVDPRTGKPKVDHHVDVEQTSGGSGDSGGSGGFTVTVHGSSGHMGSILENDGAITKMATIVRALIRSRDALAKAAGAKTVSFTQTGWKDPAHLVLEGGQGFLPTHDMEQVMRRMREAVWRGADAYFRLVGHQAQAKGQFTVTFDKLHNAAFAGKADSVEMQNFLAAAAAAGVEQPREIRGWDVSCDARIFACEYPDMNVITTGPGSLVVAHSDREQIDIRELVKFAEMLAYYILKQTGTV